MPLRAFFLLFLHFLLLTALAQDETDKGDYQLKHHLNVTGSLDSQHGSSSVDADSEFSFFSGKSRWPADKYHLLYTIISDTLPVDTQPFRTVICDAFQRWAAVSRFTFAEAKAGSPYEISIGSRSMDGPSHDLAFSYQPPTGIFWYDSSEKWSTTNPGPDQYDLESIAVHEVGHLLGLGHSNNPEAVVYATIDQVVKKVDLQEDDIQGIRIGRIFGTRINAYSATFFYMFSFIALVAVAQEFRFSRNSKQN